MAKDMMDIGLDADGDLEIVDGDFTIVESTYQHQLQLIKNNKGDFKNNPTMCVGAVNFLDDEGTGNVIREIAQEFMKDGMDVVNMTPNPAALRDNRAKIIAGAFYR